LVFEVQSMELTVGLIETLAVIGVVCDLLSFSNQTVSGLPLNELTERPNRVKLLRCQVAKERELFFKRSRSECCRSKRVV